ncbi:hypothetical protein HGRIS_009299 [Hohenbuehelia grisea]|uniref:Uncharacterized protein n=1 Tax=Hohenbuehelia grisea TaxID=104357 RepID=A0ABR3J0R0_9AGAR
MFGRLSALLAVAVLAAAAPHNDWSQACFHGECAYEMTSNSGTSGLLKLYGSPKSISDITAAAGWVVLDCDPHSMVQQIRLVCKSDNAEAAGCNHVFEHGGAIDKLVRLPENCGSGPFARIAKANIAADQSIPAHMKRHLERRGEAQPEVHLLDIDTNFAAVSVDRAGEIKFRFVGFNQPGVSMDSANFNWDENSLWFFDNAIKWVSDKASNVAKKAEETFVTVKNAAVTAGKAIEKTANDAWRTIQEVPKYLEQATSFGHNLKSSEVTMPLTLPQTTLLNVKHESCKVQAKLEVTVSGSATAKMAVGLVIEGSILPPSIKKFGTLVDLSADVLANLYFDIGLTGGVASNRIPLVDPIGIPPLSVPGIFSIGPWLQLEASARAVMDIQMQIKTGLSYKVDHLKLWYPPKVASSGAKKTIKSKDSELELSASANVQGYGFIEGHIIPSVKLGVLMGNDKFTLGDRPAKATINAYVEADVFARLTLEAEAQASGKVNIKKKSKRDAVMLDAPASEELHKLVPRSFVPPYGLKARELAAQAAKPVAKKGAAAGKVAKGKAAAPLTVTKEGSAGISACVWLDIGVAFNGGASVEIFGWKPADPKGTIWAPQPWTVFSKCWTFGEGVAPLDISRSRSRDVSFFDKVPQGQNCPASSGEKLSKVPKQKVAGKTLTQS